MWCSRRGTPGSCDQRKKPVTSTGPLDSGSRVWKGEPLLSAVWGNAP